MRRRIRDTIPRQGTLCIFTFLHLCICTLASVSSRSFGWHRHLGPVRLAVAAPSATMNSHQQEQRARGPPRGAAEFEEEHAKWRNWADRRAPTAGGPALAGRRCATRKREAREKAARGQRGIAGVGSRTRQSEEEMPCGSADLRIGRINSRRGFQRSSIDNDVIQGTLYILHIDLHAKGICEVKAF